MDLPKTFPALVVRAPEGSGRDAEPAVASVEKQTLNSTLEDDHVLVRVRYSSVNYKDALAVTGNRGVARTLPLIPGIDAAGEVVRSQDPRLQAGQQVLVAHANFGTAVDGGMAQFVTVPRDWVFEIPPPLTPADVAAIGTAGFTAAQSIRQLQQHGVAPEAGPILVTGATGGVGMFSVALLSQLGYQVTAVTGKTDRTDWLKGLGASEVIGRGQIAEGSTKPLLTGRWAGAIDTVGGQILVDTIRTTQPRGCVTACGNVAGADLPLTVFPFILRGVTLCGIDSTGVSRSHREEVWEWLSKHALEFLGSNNNPAGAKVQTISLDDVPAATASLLAGTATGRIIVCLDGERLP